MVISYEKLWQKMNSNYLSKKELAKAAAISSYTMTRLNKNQVVSMEIMLRFCKIFHCDIGDLMEVHEIDEE